MIPRFKLADEGLVEMDDPFSFVKGGFVEVNESSVEVDEGFVEVDDPFSFVKGGSVEIKNIQFWVGVGYDVFFGLCHLLSVSGGCPIFGGDGFILF